MVEGALILLAGILIGRLWPERRKGPKPVEAVCGCEHHHSMHNPENGECNVGVLVDMYNEVGGPAGKEYRSCACLRYSGPEPLPMLFAPEIAEG